MLMVGTYYFAYVGEFVYVIIGNLANNVPSDTIRKEVEGWGVGGVECFDAIVSPCLSNNTTLRYPF